MSRPRSLALAALTVLMLCFATATATAGAATKTKFVSPIVDCQKHSGRLTTSYTITELKRALRTIPTSVRQYTTCNAAITDQLDSLEGIKPVTAGNQSSGGGGSGTVILIVVIVVVILLGGGAALWAYRRNQSATGADGADEPEGPSGNSS